MATYYETLVENEIQNDNVGSYTAKGATPVVRTATIEVDSTYNDADVLVLGKLKSDDVLKKIEIVNDAITGGTDYDLGLYLIDTNGDLGTVVDADVFADGLNLSTASTRVAPLDGLTTVDIANVGKEVWELVNAAVADTYDEDPKLEYFLALTANTIGTATGTVSAFVERASN
jgi:hypothetical protein